ncbi:MAG: hypothetical protein IPN20_16630 [Haliscomenobacter sp.]|nr:hypothetical protein [Haliscomenobacter sp.]
MKTIWFLAGALALGAPILAQHHEAPAEVKTLEQHSEFKHWRIAPLIGHTMVPAGTSSDHFAIPSWGLDLEYWLNPKWGFGLHNDLEVQSFIVEHDGEEMLERESPWCSPGPALEALERIGVSGWPGLRIRKGRKL